MVKIKRTISKITRSSLKLNRVAKKHAKIFKVLHSHQSFINEQSYFTVIQLLIKSAEYFLQTDLDTILNLRSHLCNEIALNELLDLSLD